MSEVSRNLFIDKLGYSIFGPVSTKGLLLLGAPMGRYADTRYEELAAKNDPKPGRKTYGSGVLGGVAGGVPGALLGGALGGPIGMGLGMVAGGLPGEYLGIKGGAEGSGIQHILPTLSGAGLGGALGYAVGSLNAPRGKSDLYGYAGAGLGAVGGGLGGYALSKWLSD